MVPGQSSVAQNPSLHLKEHGMQTEDGIFTYFYMLFFSLRQTKLLHLVLIE